MNFKDYCLGIVVGLQGVNDNQLAEINTRMKAIMSMLGEGGSIRIFVPGLLRFEPDFGIPQNIKNLVKRNGVQSLSYITCFGGGAVTESLMMDLKRCDEVWCLPAKGQDTARSPARVAKIYRSGKADPEHSRLFKLIPSWVEAQPATEKKAKGKSK